ncbi:MAG: hypothetical protein ABS35_22685 [Kaistia sp. SCN 65-12]|nr:MAG: hypothetical protein ABS35_22685 [Kaistia sp. SCN 65-12]
MQRAAIPSLQASFADIAVDLFQIAQREAGAVSQLEIFAARYPSDTADRVLADARAAAERAGQTYQFVKALIPHEAAIRALVVPTDQPLVDFSMVKSA